MEKQQQGRDLLIDHLATQIDAQGRQMEGLAERRAAQAAQLKAAQVVLLCCSALNAAVEHTFVWLPSWLSWRAGDEALIRLDARNSDVPQDALVEVEANVEAVEAEKKRLLAQWRASLAALRARDESLQVCALGEGTVVFAAPNEALVMWGPAGVGCRGRSASLSLSSALV